MSAVEEPAMVSHGPVMGWYKSGTSEERYWDGKAWTEHFRAARGDLISAPSQSQKANALSVQFALPGPPAEAIGTWQAERTGWMAAGKFNLVGQTHDTLTYHRRYFPRWVIVVSILFFPIGLLALLAQRSVDTIALRFDPYGNETLVTLTGAAGPSSLASIAAIAEDYNAQARVRYGHVPTAPPDTDYEQSPAPLVEAS